ncbi:aspartate/glutamate racemase family protein [Hydrogenophaga taeniospiralis]|uniref:aspartate/glutamate racemase family protein n=1 Tax=Hydrogenophaga taeniospiralis TaxID=65656 RepID=UPI001CF999B1|nr:aspartate/glutamate racemase family protein [Hydrogenophaga taeniospiralis]UCU96035.1 aspartate/glutamate racemase family protein [Hydrogenophaga taeniospiralis]
MKDTKTVAEGCLGVIMLDTRFPRPPGDIGSPDTWARAGIPVRFITVPGASARRVVQAQDPALLGPFVEAARSLARQGARLITTSCGFLAGWQGELQAAVDVPVITSSLLQCARLPSPGIVTFDAASLQSGLLQRAGVPAGTPVEGLRPGCELQSRILADDTQLDLQQASDDVVEAAMRLVAKHPEVQHLVLECTNMPPYRESVSRATGRPVHDLETWLLDTWQQQRAED